MEVPNLQNNIEAVLAVMQYIYENIMYAELNTKSDYCMVCNYDGEIQIVTDEKTGKLVWECPNCRKQGSKDDVCGAAHLRVHRITVLESRSHRRDPGSRTSFIGKFMKQESRYFNDERFKLYKA